MRVQSLYATFALVSGVLGHPGHDVRQEAQERREFLQSVDRRSLSHCAKRWEESGLKARNHARRSAIVQSARQKRGLVAGGKKRDLDAVLTKSHNMTGAGYTPNTDASTLFAGIKSCILTPEVTQGPYWVSGEDVRESVVETQQGVDILLDYQVINVDTCEPVPNVYLEMWHCNATGVYSGVVAQGNGNYDDKANINKTFLRGIQKTTSEGIALFESIFPGHYTSRATHIHVMVHANATLLSNNTLGATGNSNYASHVGQAFFDQSLITDVENEAPYNTNTQDLTTNSDDSILSQEAETDGVDPVMEYELLGDDVSQGLFAWLAFGINVTASSDITPTAWRLADGGVENPNSGTGGNGDGPGGASGSPLPGASSTSTATAA